MNFQPTGINEYPAFRLWPNGTPSPRGTLAIYADNSLTNYRRLLLAIDDAATYIASDRLGSPTHLPLVFRVGDGQYDALPDLLKLEATGATLSQQLISTVATGASPLSVASTTLNTNLNADLLDGNHASAFAPAAHDILSATHGDTLAGAVARGSLIVGNATPKWSALSIGTANKILQSDGTDVAWSTYTLTLGGNSSINGTALTGTPGTLTVSTTNVATDPHTHAITSSSAPGAAASILASDANGALTLRGLLTLQPSADANKGLIIKANSGTQSADLFEAQDSSAVVRTLIDSTGYGLRVGSGTSSGNISIGAQAPNNNIGLKIDRVVASLASTSIFGVSGEMAATSVSSGNVNNKVYGLSFGAKSQHASGTVGLVCGVSVLARNTGAGTASILAGLEVQAAVNSGGGSAPVSYGVLIQDQTAATSNYALYSGAGLVRLGDQTSINLNPSSTDSIVEALGIHRNSSGTPAAGLGTSQVFYLKSSTTVDQLAASVATLWTDATHATRKAKLQLSAYDTAQRIGLEILASGTLPQIQLLGETVGNDAGDTTSDLRWETDTEANALLVDASADKVYIGGTTNGLEISKGGTLKALGTATWFDDVRVEPTVRGSGSKVPSYVAWTPAGGSASGLYFYLFDNAIAANEKEVNFKLQMPHGKLLASAIHLHIHWMPTSTGSAGQKVRWGLEYSKANPNGVFSAPGAFIYATDPVSPPNSTPTQDTHYITEFADIDMTGDALSTILLCRLFRNSSDAADTFAGDAGLLYIDCHVEFSQLGSNEEYTQ